MTTTNPVLVPPSIPIIPPPFREPTTNGTTTTTTTTTRDPDLVSTFPLPLFHEIESIQDDLNEAITTLARKLYSMQVYNEKRTMILEKRDEQLDQRERDIELTNQQAEEKRSLWLKEEAEIQRYQSDLKDTITVNVGDSNGHYFLDRDPSLFKHLLHALRTGYGPLWDDLSSDPLKKTMILDEFDYFCLDPPPLLQKRLVSNSFSTIIPSPSLLPSNSSLILANPGLVFASCFGTNAFICGIRGMSQLFICNLDDSILRPTQLCISPQWSMVVGCVGDKDYFYCGFSYEDGSHQLSKLNRQTWLWEGKAIIKKDHLSSSLIIGFKWYLLRFRKIIINDGNGPHPYRHQEEVIVFDWDGQQKLGQFDIRSQQNPSIVGIDKIMDDFHVFSIPDGRIVMNNRASGPGQQGVYPWFINRLKDSFELHHYKESGYYQSLLVLNGFYLCAISFEYLGLYTSPNVLTINDVSKVNSNQKLIEKGMWFKLTKGNMVSLKLPLPILHRYQLLCGHYWVLYRPQDGVFEVIDLEKM